MHKMQGKIKLAFKMLCHDKLMITTQKNITLGQSFLQGIWNENADTKQNSARNFPDRRLSVDDQGCVTKKTNSARDSGSHRERHDSLLGSLLAESFIAATIAPVCPALAQLLDYSSFLDAADEFWMERRASRNHAAPPMAQPILGIF